MRLRLRLALPLTAAAVLAATSAPAAVAAPERAPGRLAQSEAATLLAGPRALQIIGGGVAAEGSWPWAVLAGITSDFGAGGCTGSLIGERWVLTAAHCVVDITPGNGYPDGDPKPNLRFELVVGWEPMTSDIPAYLVPEDHLFYADGDDLYAHSEYDVFYNTHDIALIRLGEPAPFQALQLASPADDLLFAGAGAPAAVIGWGRTAIGPYELPSGYGSPLKEALLQMLPDSDCADVFYPGPFRPYPFDPELQVCAGDPGMRATVCYGDSGGPLMVSTGVSWLQVGVTSFLALSGCYPEVPAGWARISAYTGEILEALMADPVAPVGVPRARTGVATRVKQRSAVVSGNVVPNGLATTFVLEWGPTRNYANAAYEYAGAGYARAVFSYLLTRLKPGRRYHYRISAWNAAGFFPGRDRTFVTRG